MYKETQEPNKGLSIVINNKEDKLPIAPNSFTFTSNFPFHWVLIDSSYMHLISSNRKERKRLLARRAQLLEGYRIVAGMRVKRETHLKQTEHAIHRYQQRYAQANKHCQTVRSYMYRSTHMMEKLYKSNTWVTASEHERLYNKSQQCVNKLCKVRSKLSQYQQDILQLRQQVEGHTAGLIGLNRALITLTEELQNIHNALMRLTKPASNQYQPHQCQSPRIYPFKVSSRK